MLSPNSSLIAWLNRPYIDLEPNAMKISRDRLPHNRQKFHLLWDLAEALLTEKRRAWAVLVEISPVKASQIPTRALKSKN